MADRAKEKPKFLKKLHLPFGRKAKARRPGPVTALDFDAKLLRIVQTSPRGNRNVVTRIAVAPLELGAEAAATDPVAMGQAVARLLDTLRIKPGQVVMGVPRQMVILRTLSLPAVDDVREMASMVHLQMGKELPFRQDEAIIDFTCRRPVNPPPPPANGEGKSLASDPKETAVAMPKIEVLVATVRQETAAFYQKLAAAAKLNLVALGWMSQANARCVEACQVAEGNDAVALISLRADEIGVDIVANGSLLFSRGAAFQTSTVAAESAPMSEAADDAAARATAEPGNIEDAATIEAVRSLHSYGGMQPEAPVRKVVIAGATGQEAAVLQVLQKRLQLPCSLLDPAHALEIAKPAGDHAAGSVGALGLGLGVTDGKGLPFDFLNPKRPAVQRNLRRIRTLAVAAAGAVLLAGLLGFRAHLINKQKKISLQLQSELVGADKKLLAYRRMQQQAASVQKWVKDSRSWLEHYAYLSAVLPKCEDLYITSLSVSGQGNIHMAVQARSGEILASLDRQLRAAGYHVKPLAITPGNDKHGYNFRSTVELISPATNKIDLTKVQPPPRPADDGSLQDKGKGARRGGGA